MRTNDFIEYLSREAFDKAVIKYHNMGYQTYVNNDTLYCNGIPFAQIIKDNLDTKQGSKYQKAQTLNKHRENIPILIGVWLLGALICYFVVSAIVMYILYFAISLFGLFMDLFTGGPSTENMFSDPLGSFVLDMGFNCWGVIMVVIWTILLGCASGLFCEWYKQLRSFLMKH